MLLETTLKNKSFLTLVDKSDEEILSALKTYVGDGVAGGFVPNSHPTLSHLPERFQKPILDHVKPYLDQIRSLGKSSKSADQLHAQHPELRAVALQELFNNTTNTVYRMMGNTTRDRPEELESTFTLKDVISGPAQSPKSGLDAQLKRLMEGAEKDVVTIAGGLEKQVVATGTAVPQDVQRQPAVAGGTVTEPPNANVAAESATGKMVVENAHDQTPAAELAQPKLSIEKAAAESTSAPTQQPTSRLAFLGNKVTTSFGAVGRAGKILKATGMAAGFVAMVDGGRRAWGAVDVDPETGRATRNWTKTVLGGGEALLGGAITGFSAITTGKFR